MLLFMFLECLLKFMVHVPTGAHTARPGATRLTRHTDKSLRTRPTGRLSRLPDAVRYASGVVSSECPGDIRHTGDIRRN